jgi:hypothetical protein
MSVGIRRTVITPISTISIASTMKVYGRRSARRTIHMGQLLGLEPCSRRANWDPA